MGFSVAAASAIVFIAGFTAGFALAGTATKSVQEVDAAWRSAQGRAMQSLRTQAQVSNVTAAGGTLDVLVRNTGANAIDATHVDLLVDGVPVTATHTVDGAASNVWAPGSLLDLTASSGPPAAVVVVGPDGTLAAWRA